MDDPHFLNCDQEPIHRCGYVQNYGCLIVFDKSHHCIGWSENYEKTGFPAHSIYQGLLLSKFISDLNLSHPIDLDQILQDKVEIFKHRYVSDVHLNGTAHYLSIYPFDDKIYIEIERHQSQSHQFKNIYHYAQHINASRDIWKALAENIYTVTGYDRVMIYKFSKNGDGKIIAEHVVGGLDPLLGYRYPEFDIPQQARLLYTKIFARVTPDTDAIPIPILGVQPEQLDLSMTGIRAMSTIHLQYLRNAHVRASGSFSIIVNGKLWGLVACQNRTPKTIDLAQRHLSVFIVQYAVNNFLANKQIADNNFKLKTKSIEFEIRQRLFTKHDLYNVIGSLGSSLMNILKADGIAFKSRYKWHLVGKTPNQDTIQQVDNNLINNNYSELFWQSDFTGPQEGNQTPFHFPGIAKIDLESKLDFKIYFFREELKIEEIWAGQPKKELIYDPSKPINFPSPRTSFEAWKKTVSGTAPKWKERETNFLKNLSIIIQEACLKKITEIQALNEKLIEINNVLETFSYTLSHDLKNPLAALQMTAQMIRDRPGLSQEFLGKAGKNMMEAIQLMNNMLDKTADFARTKSYNFEYEPVYPERFIQNIIDDCKVRYNINQLHFQKGKILPIDGEKTLIYQLFLNLLGNAIKYSSNKEAPMIGIDSEDHGHIVVYKIWDNGIGISSEDTERIFEIFHRLPNAVQFDGSGVGLSIVKRIVERLHAKITVDSRLNEGTIFHIHFPTNSQTLQTIPSTVPSQI
ncbi:MULTISPECIES: ATP-binding protein [Sphingobacterium]|uniref:ATP-binding protein n=1 Tax=Sphingobacterium TaxID=28453 RepID=UPI0025799FDE|nr:MULTISPECIES: ATP-binding protein [Sphingobacterium]